jgi:hypothetical protein
MSKGNAGQPGRAGGIGKAGKGKVTGIGSGKQVELDDKALNRGPQGLADAIFRKGRPKS